MENEIVESEVLDMDVELQVYDKVSAAVDAAMERCANTVLCYDTPEDIKESKSFIYQLRQLKAPINQAHKEGKAEALKFTRAMDGKRNQLLGKVEAQITEKYAPIKVIEDMAAAVQQEKERAEQERVEAEEAARVAEIEATQARLDAKEAELKAKQEEIDRKEREARIAEEAKRDAEYAQAQKLIDAENARGRAEEAKILAEVNAENARKQAIVDAENAKAAAVQKAKDEADAKAAALSAHLAALEAKEKKLAEEAEFRETARINDEKHRSDVHRAIYFACQKIFVPGTASVSNDVAKSLTQALIDGNIPHVTIQY